MAASQYRSGKLRLSGDGVAVQPVYWDSVTPVAPNAEPSASIIWAESDSNWERLKWWGAVKLIEVIRQKKWDHGDSLIPGGDAGAATIGVYSELGIAELQSLQSIYFVYIES